MDTRILVAGGTLAGLAAGAAGGYYFAKKRLERAFVDALQEAVEAEVDAMEKHYKILNKTDEYSSPEEVLARRTPQIPEGLDNSILEEPHTSAELEEILKTMKYKKWSEDDTPIADEVSDKLKYWKGDENKVMGQPGAEPAIPGRPRKLTGPHQITEEAFFQGDEEYEQVSLTLYAGDSEFTLAGSEDDVPWEPHVTIGQMPTLEDFDGASVLYFRNPRTRTDFEVNLSEHSYKEFVVGIETEVS